MNKFTNDENVIKSDQAENASKQEKKVDILKLGNNVPSHIEEVGNSKNNKPNINPAQSEKK